MTIQWFNDRAIDYVLKVIEPDLELRKARRARCIAHLINLTARAFLFGSSVEAFEEDAPVPDVCQLSEEQAAQERWRKKGSIGKLYNITSYIRLSVRRKEAFAKIESKNRAVKGKSKWRVGG